MIWLKCDRECAPRDNQYVCREDGSRAFEIREELQDERGRFFEVECGNCGDIDWIEEEDFRAACEDMDRRAQRSGKVGLTKYPYIEPHTGEVVNSAEDVVRVAKAHGLHAAEHGIDERHNDEFADKLKDRERAKKERRREARKNLREAIKASTAS